MKHADIRKYLAILAFYLLLALVLTYPLALNFSTHIPGHETDGPAQTWSLWWTRYALLDLGRAPFTTDYLFYPFGLNLVAYTPVFLNGLLSIPLQLAFGVIPAQNAMVYFALVTGAFGAYLFVREVMGGGRGPRTEDEGRRREDEGRRTGDEGRRTGDEGRRTKDGGRGAGDERLESLLWEIAAVAAGALFGFGAWHLNYVVAGHFMLISNQWLPFYALYLVRLPRGRWRDAGLLALFLILTAWTELTFVPFLALLTGFCLVYLAVALKGGKRDFSGQKTPVEMTSTEGDFSARKTRPHRTCHLDSREISHSVRNDSSLPKQPARTDDLERTGARVFWGVVGKLVVVSVAALVGMLPLVLSLAADFQRYGYYLTAGVGRIQIFSAEPISFFLPSGQHPLLGAWSESITTANTSYAFIGWAVIALVAIGFYARRKSGAAWFWLLSALAFGLLMFGSTLYVGGENTTVPMPFALLRMIPFVNANRYPARFNVMLMLTLLPLFAWGIFALWNARGAVGKIALAALVGLVVFEQLVAPIPLTKIEPPAIFETIRDEPGDFTVLELPLGWRGSIVMQGETDDVAQFFQTTDHKRRLGGITSRFPDLKLRYFDQAPVLRTLNALEEGRAVDETQLVADRAAAQDFLRFFDIRYVSVYLPQVAPETMAFVRENFPLQEVYADGERAVYRVMADPAPARTEVDPASDAARLNFDDSWGHAQEDNAGFGYRWGMNESSRLWLPLDDADYELTFRLRGARPDQEVQLRVNGEYLAKWRVSETWGEYTAQAPKSAVKAGLDSIEFRSDAVALEDAAMDDRTIGGTGVASPVDISATGAGFDAGKYGEIYVAGVSQIPNKRGYHLVAVNPQTGTVDAVGSFDTFADPNASTRMAEFVQSLAQGEIVAGAAIDDASQNLTPEGSGALQALGVAGDLRGQFRAGHAFVGIKGLMPGQAVEDLNAHAPATVSIGRNVTQPQVTLALGPFVMIRK